MLFKTLLCTSALSIAVLAPAAADTLYDITFTDNSATQLISDGSGSFTVNASGQVTSFQVTFTVLKAFGEGDGINYSPGDKLVFNTASNATGKTVTVSGPLPLYNAQRQAFVSGNNPRDYKLELIETPTADPNKDGYLVMNSNNGLGTGYLVSGLALGRFNPNGDSGNWSISSSGPPPVAPEPLSAGLFLLGAAAASLLRRRL